MDKCRKIAFVDNQIIMANCEEDIDYMQRKLIEEYEKWGMNIKMEKIEYLE